MRWNGGRRLQVSTLSLARSGVRLSLPRLGDEGDHAHHASAAGTDERIDLVEPSDELGPSTAQSGQSWGRWRRLPARFWREGLRLGGVAASLCLTPRHVGVRAVVVDEVAAGIGDVGQYAGHEVQCTDGLYGFLVVAAPWPVREGWPPRLKGASVRRPFPDEAAVGSPSRGQLGRRVSFEVGRKSVDFASTRATNRRLATGKNSRLYGFSRSEQTVTEFS